MKMRRIPARRAAGRITATAAFSDTIRTPFCIRSNLSRIHPVMVGKPWMILITKNIKAPNSSINNNELNKTGMTNNTVEISANREIFPGLVYRITQIPTIRSSTVPISVGNIICQKLDPTGAFFFSVMIPIL